MKRIALIGSKAMALGICDMIQSYNLFELVGFFDDYENKGKLIYNKPILGPTDECVEMYQNGLFDYIFIASGYNNFEGREKLYEKVKGIIPLANVISPLANIHHNAQLGEGILISDGSHIHRDAIIEDNVCITLRSIVNHGCCVKSHTFFSTGVVTAGNVTIGKKCFVGVGCVISDGITICDNVWLSPGSVVIKNIKKPGHYISQAAKLINIG